MTLLERKEKIDDLNKNVKKKVLSFSYPIFFALLVYLDFDIFINYFGFEIGYFKDIIFDINLFSINILVLFILIIIFLVFSFFIVPIILLLVYKFIETRLKFINYVTILFIIVIFFSFLFLEIKGIFLSFLLFLFLSGFLFIFNDVFDDMVNKLTKVNNIESETDLKKYARNSLVSLLFLIIGFLGIVYYSYDTFKEANRIRWNSKITNDKKLGNLSFNIFLNPVMIIKNNSDIKVEYLSNYYDDLDKHIKSNNLIEKICYDKNNNEIECNAPTVKNKKEFILINKNYYYLQLSSSMKIYFKNICENSGHKSYLMLLIEEKKYGNSPGSEFNLLSYKVKNIDNVIK